MTKKIDVLAKKLDNSKLLFWTVNFISFIVMFMLTYQSKLYSDDVSLLEQLQKYDGGKVFAALGYAIDYHLTWGGRSIAAFLRAFFASQNKLLFDFVNSLIYIVFCNIVYCFSYMADEKKQTHTGLLVFIYCIMWFTIPTFGQITLWLTGSIAYLWFGTVQIAAILYFFQRTSSLKADFKNIHHTIASIASSIGLLFVGFIAGCSSEPSSCMMFVGGLAWLWYMIAKKHRVYARDYCAIIGMFFGLLFLFSAPGIYARSETVTETSGIFVRLLYRFARQTYYSGKYLIVPLMFAIVPTFFRKEYNSLREYICCEKEQIILIVLALFNVYVMVFSPGAAVRIFFTSVMLIIAASVITLKKYVIGKNRTASCAFLTLLLLLTLLSITTAMIACYKTGKPLEMQMEYNSDNIGQLL